VGSEKLERINPALVDKIIRTEAAVTRGHDELARRRLHESADQSADPAATDRSTTRTINPEVAVVGFVLVLAAVLVLILVTRPLS